VAWTDQGVLVPYQWESRGADYDPSSRYANFFVADGPSPLPAAPAVTRIFGPPRRVYHADGYTIWVWDTNLLSKLG
jgi:hypothetical protein